MNIGDCVFCIYGEKKPLDGLHQKIYLVLGIHDVIVCIKFDDDRLRGFWWAGCQSLPFPIDFAVVLTIASTVMT